MVGRVDDIVIDPASRRVVGFRLGKTSDERTWLPYENINAVGADAITVQDNGKVIAAAAAGPIGLVQAKALGGRVLTSEGRAIGPLANIHIDPDGTVTALHCAERIVDAADL